MAVQTGVAVQGGTGAEPAAPAGVTVRYHGTGGGLFVLVVKNLLLTLVTLGVYLPWARTERRKYLWQNLEVGGQRLRYHGTGGELFRGYLKVLGAYLLLFGVPFGLGQVNTVLGIVAQGVGVLSLLFLIPLAVYGSRRYRLSRTSLRGVRFGLDPGAGGYTKAFIGGYLLTLVTLGYHGPVWQNRLRTYLMRRTRFGSEFFDYDGPDREARRIGISGVLLSILTLGLYFPWYTAKQARFRIEHTGFQGARGRLDLTGWDLFKLLLLSALGTVLTLGVAFPWISTFVIRTIANKAAFVGAVDFARIERRASEGDAAADGFADALDVGIEI